MKIREFRIEFHGKKDDMALKFFSKPKHFRKHLRDHFMNLEEPWSRVILQTIGTSKGDLFRTARIEMDKGSTGNPSRKRISQLYELFFKEIKRGINASVNIPIYIRSIEKVKEKGGYEWERECFCFLTEYGYAVFSHGGAVRSAYFMNRSRSESFKAMFRRAKKTLLRKYSSKQRSNVKQKRKVVHSNVEFIVERTWSSNLQPKRPYVRLQS